MGFVRYLASTWYLKPIYANRYLEIIVKTVIRNNIITFQILTMTLNHAPTMKPTLCEMRTINQLMNVNMINLSHSNGCPVIT